MKKNPSSKLVLIIPILFVLFVITYGLMFENKVQDGQDDEEKEITITKVLDETLDDTVQTVRSKSEAVYKPDSIQPPLIPSLMAGSNSMCINWLAVKGAQQYELFCRKGEGEYEFLDALPDTAYLATGLEQNTKYSFKIRSVTKNNVAGDFSPEATDYTSGSYDVPAGEAKADLMLVATHMDDELIFFGGILPYYGKYLEKNISLVFTCDNGEKRRAQERLGLDVMGLTQVEPEYLSFLGKFRMAEGATWQEKPDDLLVLEMVQTIRRNRPQVIVSHDTKGEYGHSQHLLTTMVLTRALQKCSDPGYDLKSAKEYGTWMPKKVYLHLYSRNVISLDYSQPLSCYAGKSALDMASLALKKHPNALPKYRVYYTGDVYDSSQFGLFYSAVGADTTQDFFCNISQ